MIDRRNLYDQQIKKDLIAYDYIRIIATGQGDDYATGCLLDYTYFKTCYDMIVINLSKHQALDTDPKAMQQINVTRNLAEDENTAMLFITEEAKETILNFFIRNRESIVSLFCFDIMSA